MNEILSLKGRDEAAELSLGVSWDDLYIPEELRQKLVKYNYKCPTDIQVQCIRNYTKGNDILDLLLRAVVRRWLLCCPS